MTSNAEEYAPSPAAWVRDEVDKVTEAGTEGAEYEVWWTRAVAAFPGYSDYQTMTTRMIPLFALEPVE